ncbi:MAG: hypothetical protein LBR90_02265 [Elusimicrobiota bacterium]|jgi:hypothetical protein|nr:hypothetical protein [Elusimicrobiota bacterium]
MRKFILCALLLCASPAARALSVSDSFIYNSSFWRNNVSVSVRPAYAFAAGAEFELTEHDNFANHVYAFRLPFMLRLRDMGFALKPFYYPGNGNGASALGGKFIFSTDINRDDVNESFSSGYISVAYADNDAPVRRAGSEVKESFKQLAWEAGVNISFFERYAFEFGGNMYQYLSGIGGVAAVDSVLNQQELADLGTLDYTLGLPKGSAGLKIKWLSSLSRSDNFISYRYIEMYRQKNMHSLLLFSSVNFAPGWYFDLSYNHLFISGQTDRDFYGAAVSLRF